jgi:hypothetical protein
LQNTVAGESVRDAVSKVKDAVSRSSLPVHQVVEIAEAVRGAVDKFDDWATHVKDTRDELERENHCHLLLSSLDQEIFAILKGNSNLEHVLKMFYRQPASLTLNLYHLQL